MRTVCKVLTQQGLLQVRIKTCRIQNYSKARNFGRCNFHINGHKAFRINFRIVTFVCLHARIMPHPLVSHRSFIDVFNRFRANVSGQGSTGVWKDIRRLEILVQRRRSIYTFHVRDYHPVQNLTTIKLSNANIFALFIFVQQGIA